MLGVTFFDTLLESLWTGGAGEAVAREGGPAVCVAAVTAFGELAGFFGTACRDNAAIDSKVSLGMHACVACANTHDVFMLVSLARYCPAGVADVPDHALECRV